MQFVSKKIKLLIFLLCLVVLISTVNTTYSRYASSSTGTVTTEFARWQIFVNSQNVTENYSSSLTFTPVIEENANIAANKMAPTSSGYFDVAIDPTNVDVSFTYDISLSTVEGSQLTDIVITSYAIVEGTEITGDSTINKQTFTGASINNTLIYDNEMQNFSFTPFVVRVFFSWIDDETGTMTDEEDSVIGNAVANDEEVNFDLNASINFKQYLGEEIENGTVQDNEEQNVENEGTT